MGIQNFDDIVKSVFKNGNKSYARKKLFHYGSVFFPTIFKQRYFGRRTFKLLASSMKNKTFSVFFFVVTTYNFHLMRQRPQ